MKIYINRHMDGDCCSTAPASDSGHSHSSKESSGFQIKTFLPAIISLLMLLIGIYVDNYMQVELFQKYRFFWYLLAYLPVSAAVLKNTWLTMRQGKFFTEFSLMSLATIGAFFIKEYPEGVAVMLFYSIGELFQDAAVRKAKGNIQALLDVRPQVAHVRRNGDFITVHPQEVEVGELLQVKVGEGVPLDGTLLSSQSSFDTVALTGESTPRNIKEKEAVLAGMVNLERVVELRVEKSFDNSAISRILELVQNASSRKAKTELFIRRFAEIYTPIVFFLAVALVTIPYFVLNDYVFKDWLYRGLVFLVISCPCALVISIPLGYFGGIGAASAKGILFKGSNYLDLMTKVNTVVLDKTGTLTKGVFKVQEVHTALDKTEFYAKLKALERKSNHPVAKAVVAYELNEAMPDHEALEVEEIAGYGLKGKVNGSLVLAGNARLLELEGIDYDRSVNEQVETIILVAIDGQYAGYVTIADEIKADAVQAIDALHQLGIKRVVMLSGDKNNIAQKVAQQLHIDEAYGDLLPEDKVKHIERLKQQPDTVLAFTGDGINDAPALALSDVGIAMGAMGSDVAIETADVIIQTDQPQRIATAIHIGKMTQRIVWQNIGLAFGVKAIVLILGAGGIASMWEAVFADVGVAFLAILNAIRIMKMSF